jgi:superfamily II DNA or RNA helicase
MPKIILADRIYIPKKLVDMRLIKKGYERHLYNEKKCMRCENKPDRFNDICAVCPGHLGFFKTWKKDNIKGTDYIGLPIGNRKLVYKYTGISFNDANVYDIRANVKAKHPLTFVKKLRDGTEKINGIRTANQKAIVKDFWKFKNGMIKAKPRTGKTVAATYLITKFKRRTLFITHEKELLKQALRTIRGFTDVRELEKKYNRKLVGIIQKPSDWNEEWDIVLCTYQKFIHKKTGIATIKKHVREKFGLIVVDEAHRGNAEAYVKFLTVMDMKYRLMLTATDKRKDGKDFLVDQFLGPVVVEDDTPAMVPNVKIHYTGITPKYEWRGMTAFVKAISWLAEHEERNKRLVKQVFKDLRENDKHCIVIPVNRVNQAIQVAQMINDQAEYNNKNKGEDWSRELALPLYDKCNPSRTYVMKAARTATETRVIVSIVKMVREGTDVEAWTHLYLQFPMSNEANFFQMTQRICTPYEGKPEPVLRIYVDNIGLSYGCFAGTWGHGIMKYKYKIDADNRAFAMKILDARKVSKKSYGNYGEDSEKTTIKIRW